NVPQLPLDGRYHHAANRDVMDPRSFPSAGASYIAIFHEPRSNVCHFPTTERPNAAIAILAPDRDKQTTALPASPPDMQSVLSYPCKLSLLARRVVPDTFPFCQTSNRDRDSECLLRQRGQKQERRCDAGNAHRPNRTGRVYLYRRPAPL